MPGDFFERVDELRQSVGHGSLKGTVEVDQVYAWNQHEEGWVNFMGRYGPKPIRDYHQGGGPKYLGGPLLEDSREFFQHIADRLFDPNGPIEAMIDDVEQLADESAARAPFEFGDLRGSGHPVVTDDGTVVYDRPPAIPRLSEEALEAKEKLRGTIDRSIRTLDHDAPQ